jgi:hypothetical protein
MDRAEFESLAADLIKPQGVLAMLRVVREAGAGSCETWRVRGRRLCLVRNVKKHPRLKYPFAAIRKARRQRIPLTV